MSLESLPYFSLEALCIIKDEEGRIVYPKNLQQLSYIFQLVKANATEYFHPYSKMWYKFSTLELENNEHKYYFLYYLNITKYKKQTENYELDETTGIFLKKKLFEEYHKYILEVQQTGEEFATIMADIDFFKKVNDTYGHQVGDEVLYQLAQLIYTNIRHHNDSPYSLRNQDLLGRYGGEEFLIILKNIPQNIALNKVENIRKIIATTPFIYQKNTINITCSFGIVHVPPNEVKKIPINDIAMETISLSDQALYDSKKNGRNRVTLKKFKHPS